MKNRHKGIRITAGNKKGKLNSDATSFVDLNSNRDNELLYRAFREYPSLATSYLLNGFEGNTGPSGRGDLLVCNQNYYFTSNCYKLTVYNSVCIQ